MLVIDIHYMSLTKLPAFEKCEEGSQIRRSSKSVKSNIVEGYGRRRYKQEFIKFLTYAIASNDETIDHLDNLFQNNSLSDVSMYNDLSERLNRLGKKLNLFLQSVNKNHKSER
jgi:four helix bundle protein